MIKEITGSGSQINEGPIKPSKLALMGIRFLDGEEGAAPTTDAVSEVTPTTEVKEVVETPETEEIKPDEAPEVKKDEPNKEVTENEPAKTEDESVTKDKADFKSLTEDEYLAGLKRAREIRKENIRVKKQYNDSIEDGLEKDRKIAELMNEKTASLKKEILKNHGLPEKFIKYLDAAGDDDEAWEKEAKDLADTRTSSAPEGNTLKSGRERETPKKEFNAGEFYKNQKKTTL